MSDSLGAMGGGSGGLGLASSLVRGIGQYDAGQQRANLMNANAGIAGQQARSELDAGTYNEDLIRRRAAGIQGAQVAAIGANGIQQGGTASNVVADTAAAQEGNALQTRNNALRKAWGFNVQGASDAFQANQAGRAGDLNAIGTVMSGAYKFASRGQTGGLTLPIGQEDPDE